ncbi:putative protein kinase RLK-Pelle-DLSV family [Helianthus debilis subsp. tardiflorus]
MRRFSNYVQTDKNMNTELHYFTFQSISSATNNFSSTNKLGKGGFGEVYKGKLVDGQEVAVKRLSKTSGQGVKEFKNESELIAKLHVTPPKSTCGVLPLGGVIDQDPATNRTEQAYKQL